MTARGAIGPVGLVAAVLARAEAWFLESVEPAPAAQIERPPRPVVAVRGLTRACGTTTLARALAAALATEDPRGAAVVTGRLAGPGTKLGTPAAARLAADVRALGCDRARAAGRLCLVAPEEPIAAVVADRPCPVVIEVPASSEPGEGLGLADHVVLVTPAEAEPALATAVESSLVRAGRGVDVVVNRVCEGTPTELPPGATAVPEARLAAQVALACRGAHGPLAAPLAALASRCRARARE